MLEKLAPTIFVVESLLLYCIATCLITITNINIFFGIHNNTHLLKLLVQANSVDKCILQYFSEKKVAFSARIYNQPDSIYLPNETIIFETVYYNEGSGYNSSSGVFTAPKSGTYIFTVNIEATNDGRGHVLVMVNGNYYCEALAAKGYYNKGGCTAVAYVYSGQQAWVQAADVGLPQIYVYKYRTQFNGFLID